MNTRRMCFSLGVTALLMVIGIVMEQGKKGKGYPYVIEGSLSHSLDMQHFNTLHASIPVL